MLDWLKSNAGEIGTGFLFILMGTVAAAGRVFGRKPEPPAAVELAGAVIDNAAIAPLIKAYGENSAALRASSHALARAMEAVRDNTKAVRESDAAQTAALAEMRRIGDDIARISENTEETVEQAKEAARRLEAIKDQLLISRAENRR